MNLAKIAFDAYCTNRDGVTYDEKPALAWDDLPPGIRGAWAAAVEAVLAAAPPRAPTFAERHAANNEALEEIRKFVYGS